MTSLDGEALLRVNRAVEGFEDTWKRGSPLPLEDLMRGEPDDWARAELLRYALAVELDFRRRQGEFPTAEGFERRFPDYPEVVRDAFAESRTLTVPSGTTMVASPPEDDEAAGDHRRIGRYEIAGRLGEGGQGEAFLANDTELIRQVVLKRYHASGEAAVGEARALCRVRSANTARCLDLLRHAGALYLVMEYIPGRSLATIIKQGRLPEAHAVRLAGQVAEGLEAVHACGLVHRDVKPSNVIVGDDGVARLVDFGLAAYLGSTDLDTLSGSPPYMAPEQARRQPERIDARTDLYGVGGLLYAMLTGEPPHPGKSWEEKLDHARRGEVTPPRAIEGTIPVSLERVVLKALAADPGQRHASAADLGRDLRRYRLKRRVAPALLGVAAALALLIPIWALWARGTPARGSKAVVGEDREMPAAAPRPTYFGITRFPKLAEDSYDYKRAGILGTASFTTREDDDLTIAAELSEPAYSYLIAFRPDGTDQLCDPVDEDTPPPLAREPRYPPPSQATKRYRLNDGAGLQAFALVVSRDPLPPYNQWKRKHGPMPWASGQPCEPGVVWLDDNRGLRPLLPEAARLDRGKGATARDSGGPVAKLASWLRGLPGVDAVALEAFSVEPASGP